MAETGHAKNVANLATMISFVDGYGGDYKPSNAAIQLPQLNTLLTNSNAALDDVQTKLVPWKNGVADRENTYDGIRKLSTRLVNALEASGAPANKVDNLKTFHRQIQGARAKALPQDDPDTPENEASGNSVSHQSYVQIAEAFAQQIELLEGEPLYNPNEVDLQVATLQTRLTNMQNANAAVTAAATPLSNSRIARNQVLYAEDTGLCDIAALVKKYVKSLYGADSPQYKQISGLEFRKSAV